MAMARICAVGAMVLAQASAKGFEWDRYMKEYAGEYHEGPVDGEFSDYVQRSAKDFSADEQKYGNQYSQDRIGQAKKYEDGYAGAYEPALGQATLLVEMPAVPNASAREQNASAPQQNFTELADEALAAKRRASKRAEAAIEELRKWDAELKRDLHSKAFAFTVARGIMAKAEAAYEPRREELGRHFDAALQALDATTLATASSSKVEKAENAAKAAMEAFKEMDHAEAKAMRATLKSLEREGKAKARTLERLAREAAHQVLSSAKDVERFQRKAGVDRRQYERDEDHSERAGEKLLRHAEEVADRTKDHVERQHDKVERHLEDMMDDLHDKVQHADNKARRERLHRAKHLVREARKAVKDKAAKVAGKEVKDTPLQGAPAKGAKEKAEPSVFLTQSSSRGLGTAPIAPFACVVAVAAAASALLAWRPWRRTVAVEHPMLG